MYPEGKHLFLRHNMCPRAFERATGPEVTAIDDDPMLDRRGAGCEAPIQQSAPFEVQPVAGGHDGDRLGQLWLLVSCGEAFGPRA
jgi:hypothetical protein